MNTKVITKTMQENLNRFIQHSSLNVDTNDILTAEANKQIQEKTVVLKRNDGLFEKTNVIEKMGKKIISEDNRQFLRD
jgi:hypothetical protein